MTLMGSRMAQLRKRRKWSQADLAKAIDASREIIGKYERGDTVASIEMTKRIADAFGVSIDYLAKEEAQARFDQQMLKRLQEIETLDPAERQQLFFVIDAVLRDSKARRAYAV